MLSIPKNVLCALPGSLTQPWLTSGKTKALYFSQQSVVKVIDMFLPDTTDVSIRLFSEYGSVCSPIGQDEQPESNRTIFYSKEICTPEASSCVPTDGEFLAWRTLWHAPSRVGILPLTSWAGAGRGNRGRMACLHLSTGTLYTHPLYVNTLSHHGEFVILSGNCIS
jgi:hypothetical protein